MLPQEICILGLDAGITGALAFFFPSAPGRGVAEDLPVAGGRIDVVTLADRIRQMAPTVAIVEAVHSMPRQGVSSSFNFGVTYGSIIGVLGALAVPRHFVTPSVWKRHFKLSRDKEASRALALQRFPLTGNHFARRRDHNRAEAALLCLYAHELKLGQ